MADDPVWELTEALRLTVEYAQLPARPGWSWFDTLSKYRPELNLARTGACPTCMGASRQTVGMVCQTCGRDYGPPQTPNELADIKEP